MAEEYNRFTRKLNDTTYYTAGDLDGGQLDDRYYTETEIDQVVSDYGLLVIEAGDMMPATTDGATFGHTEYGTNDVDKDYYAFDNATKEYTQYSATFPENWDRGTIKAKFIWASATGSTTADVATWGVSATAAGNGTVADRGFGTEVTIADALLADDGAQIQMSGATAAVTVSGTVALGDDVNLRFSRAASGMTEDAWLFKVKIQYGIDNTVTAW